MAIETIHWNETPTSHCRGASLAIGNFDGVHVGHLALLNEVRTQATARRTAAVIMTFDPHPLQLLRPEAFQPLLTTVAERAQLLLANGADHVLVMRTTQEMLNLSAREFFRGVVQERLAPLTLTEGPNFGFGRNREGDVEMLARLCPEAGIAFNVVAPLTKEGRPVSSSQVRRALAAGDVRQATNLLNRPYRLQGRVGVGRRRGKSLGFPTANLDAAQTMIPGDGVYAVLGRHAERSWPGAANIGANPTFGEHIRKVEVHLIGFEGELVGEELAVDFLERLRDTKAFAGPGELVEQLQIDVRQARQVAESLV